MYLRYAEPTVTYLHEDKKSKRQKNVRYSPRRDRGCFAIERLMSYELVDWCSICKVGRVRAENIQ